MLLDVVILPPWMLRNRLGKKITRATSNSPCVFVVDNKKLIPHLSLFHIKTSKNRSDRLSRLIKEIVKEYHPFKIYSQGFKVQFGGKGGGFSLSKSRPLVSLHEEILNKCYHLRTGVMPWPWSALSKLTKQKRIYRRKYGTSYILKLFHPHFTMVLLKNGGDSEKVARKMFKTKFVFLADTIAVCEVNFYHQVTKILKTFKLHG